MKTILGSNGSISSIFGEHRKEVKKREIAGTIVLKLVSEGWKN